MYYTASLALIKGHSHQSELSPLFVTSMRGDRSDKMDDIDVSGNTYYKLQRESCLAYVLLK